MVLISETNEASLINTFLSYYLSCFQYKTISKLLANHFVGFATQIVSIIEFILSGMEYGDCIVMAFDGISKFDFIKGRNMENCIVMAFICVNLLDKKMFEYNVDLKVDIRNAFDSMSWTIIFIVLRRFVFQSSFLVGLEILFNQLACQFFSIMHWKVTSNVLVGFVGVFLSLPFYLSFLKTS